MARPRTRQRTMPASMSPRSVGVDEALLRRGPVAPTTRKRTPPAPLRPHPTDNEGEDFPPLREALPAGKEIEDIAGSAEAPPNYRRGRATLKTRKSRTR